jgi:hypothetical protein
MSPFKNKYLLSAMTRIVSALITGKRSTKPKQCRWALITTLAI